MDIIILIVAILVSLVPSLLLYKWIQKKEKDEKYKKIYKSAFVKGIIAIFPIILTSLIFNIIGRISGLKDLNPLLYQLYYKFIVLAFAEELVKFIMFKNVLKKNKYEYSWYNLTILIVMVGLGFECIENVTFSFGSGIIEMFIKGISLGHAGYGFIMGWFYGKMQKTGKKIYGLFSFLIPWFLHGLYDFGLSKELLELNDNFAAISISLELVCLICVFLIIRFVRKRKDSEIYTEPCLRKTLILWI